MEPTDREHVSRVTVMRPKAWHDPSYALWQRMIARTRENEIRNKDNTTISVSTSSPIPPTCRLGSTLRCHHRTFRVCNAASRHTSIYDVMTTSPDLKSHGSRILTDARDR